jgi:hypothetical protein
MVVRVRFGRGRRVLLAKGKNRRFALALSALMTPAAVMASVLGIWRLAADLSLAGEFGISRGLFSHWQVWFVFAALLQGIAWMLNRYGQHPDQAS